MYPNLPHNYISRRSKDQVSRKKQPADTSDEKSHCTRYVHDYSIILPSQRIPNTASTLVMPLMMMTRAGNRNTIISLPVVKIPIPLYLTCIPFLYIHVRTYLVRSRECPPKSVAATRKFNIPNKTLFVQLQICTSPPRTRTSEECCLQCCSKFKLGASLLFTYVHVSHMRIWIRVVTVAS